MNPFLHNCAQRVRYGIRALNLGSKLPAHYVRAAPSQQNALDIFKGEWWSRLPEPFDGLKAGRLAMFEDPRITWALSQFGDVQEQAILELGPLEGGHSYMFERAGAGSVIAIEANPRAYLRCLVVKEIVGLRRTQFLCGDFVEYLRNDPARAYAVCASGVLYHMTDPAELIALLSRVTDRLFLWTHYYDAAVIGRNRKQVRRFTNEHEHEFEGFRCPLIRYNYWGSLVARGFCGGSRPYSHWMRREDILRCLRHFGFSSIRTAFDVPDHPDGPSFALFAQRE